MYSKSRFSFFVKFLPLVLVTLILSCEKDDLDFSEPVAVEIQPSDDMEIFRRKVENPYTITNMQMAIDSIMFRMEDGLVKTAANEKATLPSEMKIKPNVLYIQFNPKTFEQEGLLKKDSTLALIDYPLGYEYDDAWFKNRPKLNKGEIPSYYTSVHVDRELPKGVPHKVLAEMYLPQQDEDLENTSASLYRNSKNQIGDFVTLLLNQAFKQTNNEGLDGLGIFKEETQSQNKFLGIGIGEKWHPQGTLRIWDSNIGSTITYKRVFLRYENYPCDNFLEPDPIAPNELIPLEEHNGECQRAIYWNQPQPAENGSYVPLKGAQVLLRDTFTIGNEITNSNGYFSFDELRGEKRFIIQWERFEYSIRNGSLFQAETRGPKQNRRWDHDIRGGDDEYHGMIHLAAHDYYYGSRFGLISPPRNSFGSNQIKIAARELASNSYSSFSHIKGDLTFGIAPQIHIKANDQSSDKVYGVTIHELAHAAHFNLTPNSYDNIVRDSFIGSSSVNNNNRRLLETWAKTVEIVFALKRYNLDAGNSDYEYYVSKNGYEYENYQNLTITQENHYTSAGFDMLDDFNQRVENGSDYPIDRVDGYTISQLETALIGADAWWVWRDNIKSKYNNPTRIFLDELFDNWAN